MYIEKTYKKAYNGYIEWNQDCEVIFIINN